MALGWSLKRIFKFPAWTVPAICFNNTTALPLLLLQSLESAGILQDLMKDTDRSTQETLKRAKSYFLIASMVGNSLTFALGPGLLDDEETPDSEEEKEQNEADDGHDHYQQPRNPDGNTAEDEEEALTEETTLLPHRLERPVARASVRLSRKSRAFYSSLPDPIQTTLSHVNKFLNAPLIGALTGVIIGLVPPLHIAFFSEPEHGGIFKAWLTQSISNIGELFASLQLVVVGAKLSTSLSKAKKGEDSGYVPLYSVFTVFFIRFLLWPAISISTIFILASKTNLLDKDPVLWFVMMLLPTGPPATKLAALADVSGADESQKLAISKFLAISYAFSPIICIAVVGSLKACQSITS